VTKQELTKVKDNQVLQLPGSWATNGQVLGALVEMVQFGYPEDWYRTYPDKVKGLDVATVQAAAGKVVRPESFAWVVVGDRAKIEAGLRELGIEDIRPIDTDGNPL
jgi:zinc protease